MTALNPTDSVADGFLPAAARLGLPVTLLTPSPWPSCPASADMLACDVRDIRSVIDTIGHHERPAAIFSNSDHLQATTALAASFFGLPAKPWTAALAAKNKSLMRRTLAAAGVEDVRSVRLLPSKTDSVRPQARSPHFSGDFSAVRPVAEGPRGTWDVRPEAEGSRFGVTFPAVVKPREGVASEDVRLVRDQGELSAFVEEFWDRRPEDALVAEEYLPGPLHTLETLGDGSQLWVLGGFRTTLGDPPYFIEERLTWEPPRLDHQEHVLTALKALGVGFGACHTEYVVTPDGPRVIEVNYRAIGDNCDFLLADILDIPLFELILLVHLGHSLPLEGPPSFTRFGIAESVVADRSGTIIAAPPAANTRNLVHRPLRAVGDIVQVTHTNRDYLGIIRATGSSPDSVEQAIAAFRSANPWDIQC